MMNLSKKALALAVATAVVGGGASLAQAQAVVNPGGLGQVVIYPYMVANNGWTSFLHVINTSPTATVAAKVRFRSAVDSADVYDIIVVLSPSDMWTGTVETQGSTVGFRATDSTCTVPYWGKGVFTPFGIQASELYAEVMMMGVSTSTNPTTNPIAAAAKHTSAGTPANCAAVEQAFGSLSGAAFVTSEFATSLNGTGTAATNFLAGKYDLVNVGLGQSGAARATVVANFGAPAGVYPAGSRIANTNMWAQIPGDWDHPTLAEGTSGLTGINTLLSKSALINEWVLNPGLGELSSWVVTFPTKKLTVDAISAWNTPTANTPKVATFGLTDRNCVTMSPTLFNREEKQLILASPGTTSLCNEVNVINFKNGSIDSSSVLGSKVAITLDTGTQTGVLAGWMELGIASTMSNILHTFTPLQTSLPSYIATPVAAPAAAVTPSIRPMIGFNITSRVTPADAVLYDHAYAVPAP